MVRLLGWLMIMVSFGMMYLWQPEFFQHTYNILKDGDIIALSDYLRSFGAWSIVATLLLFILVTFTVVFPFMILYGAAGSIYGLFWGIVISWLGEVMGAVAMFIFARYFFGIKLKVGLIKVVT